MMNPIINHEKTWFFYIYLLLAQLINCQPVSTIMTHHDPSLPIITHDQSSLTIISHYQPSVTISNTSVSPGTSWFAHHDVARLAGSSSGQASGWKVSRGDIRRDVEAPSGLFGLAPGWTSRGCSWLTFLWWLDSCRIPTVLVEVDHWFMVDLFMVIFIQN